MINRNYKNIYENVGSNIQDTSSAMQTISKRLVNNAYFDFLRRTNFKAINSDYSFAATTQDSVLPSDFGKEIAVYDATNLIALSKTTQEIEIDQNVSTIAQTGTVARYAILDLPVRLQPSSAGTISVVSSSTSDNTQTVFIRGVAGGVEVSETLSLNGTTPAVSSNSYTRYRAISKSATTVGKVTGTQGSDSIFIMAPEDIDYKVKVCRLYSSPASSTTINMPYIINPLPLVNDYDTPIVDAADIIEMGATTLAWLYKRQFSKAKDTKGLFEQLIDNYIWSQENQPNDSHDFSITSYPRDNV